MPIQFLPDIFYCPFFQFKCKWSNYILTLCNCILVDFTLSNLTLTLSIYKFTQSNGILLAWDKGREWVFWILGRVASSDFLKQTTWGCSDVPLGPRNSRRLFAEKNHKAQLLPNWRKSTSLPRSYAKNNILFIP